MATVIHGILMPLVLAILLAIVVPTPGLAGEADVAANEPETTAAGDDTIAHTEEEEEEEEAPAPSGLSQALSKLTVHGYLTQAWATADFVDGRLPPPPGVPAAPTFDELALGIPEDGTFSYRTAAIQFRYEMSPKDVMVVQLSSRKLGDSPINDVEDEVELDWAFYERRLGDNTSIKVGRVQIPLGIFNEIRDVGTILPFYRPPFVFYREGTFTSETVDGIDLSHTFWPESNWSLDTDFYIGDWESFELSFFDQSLTIAQNEGMGFQLWLNTPTPGLRFGLGGHTRDVTGGAEGAVRRFGATSTFDDWYVSVDGVFDRFVFRGEYREFAGDPEPVPVFLDTVFDGTIILYYLQLGFHPTEQFRIYLQGEYNPTENVGAIFTRNFDVTIREDIGIALNYLFSPSLVLKAEYHEVSGEDLGFFPVFTPTGVLLEPVISKLDGGSYAIVSFSVSF